MDGNIPGPQEPSFADLMKPVIDSHLSTPAPQPNLDPAHVATEVTKTQPISPNAKLIDSNGTGDLKLPEHDVEQAVLTGRYTLPADKLITVTKGDKTFEIAGDKLKDVLNDGYRLETSWQRGVREAVADNNTLSGSAKVFARSMGNELMFGIPGVLAKQTSDPYESAKTAAIDENHKFADIAGSATGIAGSFLYGGEFYKGAEGFGKAGQAIVAKKLEEFGVKRGAESLAKDILARTAENATRLGLEGVALAAPRAMTEAMFDPEAGAESLAIGGALGATLGMVGGPASKMLENFNKKIVEREAAELAGKEAQSAFTNAVGERTIPNPTEGGDGSLMGSLKAQGADPKILTEAQAELLKVKPHAPEIIAAAKRNGWNVTEGMVSSSKTIQDMDSALAKMPTVFGTQRQAMYDKIFDGYDVALKDILKVNKEGMDAFTVGEKVKLSLIDEAEKAIEPTAQLFDALGMSYNHIPVAPAEFEDLITNLTHLDHPGNSKAAQSRLSEILEILDSGRITTLDELRQFRTRIYQATPMAADATEKNLIAAIGQGLLDHEERAIDAYAEQLIKKVGNRAGEGTLQEVDRLTHLFELRKQANSEWRDLISHFNDASEAMNLGPIRSPRDFIENLKDTSAEGLVKRLAPKNDVASLRLLQQKFPSQFEHIMDLQKYDIGAKVTVDGAIRPWKFFQEYKKLSPQMREVLFGKDAMQVIDDIKIHHEALPRDVNPAGTAKTIGLMNSMMSHGVSGIPGQIMANVHDLHTEATLRKSVSIEGVSGTRKQMSYISDKLDKVLSTLKSLETKAVKSVDKVSGPKSIDVLQRAFGEKGTTKEEAFQRLQKEVAAHAADPGYSSSKLQAMTNGLSNSGAPKTAAAFQMQAARAIAYVNQAMPKPVTMSTPFHQREFKPSAADMGKFERKLSVVLDPFTVVDRLKDGSLTRDHMEALSVNYPVLYKAMRARIINYASENQMKLPYATRLKVGLLMGFDADLSTSPQSILSYQNAFAFAQADQDNKLSQSGLNKMKPGESEMTQAQHGLKLKS